MSATAVVPPERLNVRRAAEFLGVSNDTIYRRTAEGRLSHFRIGNRLTFAVDELHRFLREAERPRTAGPVSSPSALGSNQVAA